MGPPSELEAIEVPYQHHRLAAPVPEKDDQYLLASLDVPGVDPPDVVAATEPEQLEGGRGCQILAATLLGSRTTRGGD